MSEQIIIFSQIVFIDLVLAGDNAIIIGMVASQFPPEQRKKIIFWGIGGAVLLRIILTLLTAYLLQISGLRLIGGIALLYICYKLYVDVIKKSSNESENIKVDSSTKQYKFDKGNYKDNTGASNQEVENMQKEVNDINNKVKEAKHVKVENGQLVTYATDQEVNNELEKKGYTTNRDNSNNVSLESGGISKAVYGKKGSVTMYLSHGATTAVVSAGAAGALGGLIGGTLGGFIGSFAGHIVSTYGGKAIPKNGIIVKGKVDGTVYSITTQ